MSPKGKIQSINLNYRALHPVIVLIYGCMRAGKTEQLFHQIENALQQLGKRRVVIFKPYLDDRTGSEIRSRAFDHSYEAHVIKKPEEVFDHDLDPSSLVIFDELQFYPKGITSVAEELCGRGHTIIAAGLDKKHDGSPFLSTEAMAKIAPLHIHLVATCHGLNMTCENGATNSFRKSANEADFEIGDDSYDSLCEDCFERAMIAHGRRTVTDRTIIAA
jgi:thymidine kinase